MSSTFGDKIEVANGGAGGVRSHHQTRVSLQDYDVLDLLGKGGFACVYRARCKTNGQEVAIKMVSYCNIAIL